MEIRGWSSGSKGVEEGFAGKSPQQASHSSARAQTESVVKSSEHSLFPSSICIVISSNAEERKGRGVAGNWVGDKVRSCV